MDERILELIKVEDVPDGSRDLVEIFGMDTFMELVDYCGGSNVYIPSKSAIVKKARIRVIKEEFDGGNFRELSCKFGISDIQVRKIVK